MVEMEMVNAHPERSQSNSGSLREAELHTDSGYVLIISHDRNCRRLYVDNLLIRGYLAAGVASVKEGLRLLRNYPPSLILICQMPEREEAELRRIRNVSGLDSTPIVLSNIQPPDPDWMVEWGIEAFIPFGVDVRQLIKRLAPWLPFSDEPGDMESN
jgi:DNA-binding NtrC family response regulator